MVFNLLKCVAKHLYPLWLLAVKYGDGSVIGFKIKPADYRGLVFGKGAESTALARMLAKGPVCFSYREVQYFFVGKIVDC